VDDGVRSSTSSPGTGGSSLPWESRPARQLKPPGVSDAPTLTAADRTLIADGGGIEGGDPSAPPVVVATILRR
jgi:hypothetical protein